MVFTLGLRHTFALWQRALALVQSLVVQSSLASFRGVVVKTFRCAAQIEGYWKPQSHIPTFSPWWCHLSVNLHALGERFVNGFQTGGDRQLMSSSSSTRTVIGTAHIAPAIRFADGA